MAAFGLMELILMVMLGGGSMGNDLIDYLPSNLYWQTQGVELKSDVLLHELDDKPGVPVDARRYIENLGSASAEVRDQASEALRKLGGVVVPDLEKASQSSNPEVAQRAQLLLKALHDNARAPALRRLMAIRALGELKDPSAAAVLTKLAKSKRPFEAEYAQAALAAIAGKPVTRKGITPAERAGDLWLLPKDSGLVAQMAIEPGGPVDLRAMVQPMTAMMGGEPQALDAAVEGVTRQVLQIAQRTGNLRLTSVTLGLNENPKAGAVIILRGLYDAKALGPAIQSANPQAAITQVGGVEVVEVSQNRAYLVLADSHRAVLIAGDPQLPMPVEAMVNACQAGKGTLNENKDLVALLKTVDTTLPIWGVAKMNDSYRQLPNSQPFDSVTLAGIKAGDMGSFTVTATGKDPVAVAASVQAVNQEIEKVKAELAQPRMGALPFTQAIKSILDSVRCASAGGTATLRWEMKGSPLGIVLGVLLPG